MATKTAAEKRMVGKNGKTAKPEKAKTTLTIEPPNFKIAEFIIRGDAPYVQNKFSAKAKQQIHDTQAQGSTAKKGKKRDPKDFMANYEAAMHISEDGWHGIPAASFRCAMISACRVCGFHMTKAKLAVFTMADGFDKDSGDPLVKITKGKPQYHEGHVRLESGVVDLRARPMWKPGWEAKVRIRFDADMFTLLDLANLMHRVGVQVGIGEGRPDSKKSNGMGWGTFEVLDK